MTESQLQPRVGLAYYIPATNTVLRASYNRVFYTPEYENILFSSSAEAAATRAAGGPGLARRSAAACCPSAPSGRTRTTSGFQQALGSNLRLDVDFWWRRAKNAGDQDQFENTGIVFPARVRGGQATRLGRPARPRPDRRAPADSSRWATSTPSTSRPPPAASSSTRMRSTPSREARSSSTTTRSSQIQGGIFYDFGKYGRLARRRTSATTRASSPTRAPKSFSPIPTTPSPRPTSSSTAERDLDPNRIEPRTIWTSRSARTSRSIDIPVSLQVDFLNAFDEEGVYNIQSVFGGTHVIPPRTYRRRRRSASSIVLTAAAEVRSLRVGSRGASALAREVLARRLDVAADLLRRAP